MENTDLIVSYQLIAELLLSPDERDADRVAMLRMRVHETLPEVGGWVSQFLAIQESSSREEYLQTLELSPPCPLYMGAHLFDEPSTCNGVGSSARNAYMIELGALYSHFGFTLEGKELPDFIPAMIDFLWISLEDQARDTIGLRRRFVERYVQIGLEPLRDSLDKYESPYGLLIAALECVVTEDLRRMGDLPAWTPPIDQSSQTGVSLPVLSEREQEFATSEQLVMQMEDRP